MTADPEKLGDKSVLRAGWSFLRDFAAYAGRRGIMAAVFSEFGAVLEGVGLVLLVPLLGVVFGTGPATGKLQRGIDALFHAVGAGTALQKLAFILAAFAVLMVVRAVVVSIRSVIVTELQIGFVESLRLRITERLAGARWDQVTRLRHARVTHVMSGDIQRVGGATIFLSQGIIAVAMLVVQCALAFVLAPLLACLAFALLVIGGFALGRFLRRTHELGGFFTSANLTLLDSTAQFLGGLKLAISQDLQGRFVTEFNDILHALKRRQLDYTRQQTNGRLALTTLSALIAAALVLLGFGMFHVSPAILTTLLVVVARMSTPANQIQQSAQQLAHALPAYEEIRALESELAAASHEAGAAAGEAISVAEPVAFQDVTFVHDDEPPEDGVLRGVSHLTLTIRPGEFLGVTGPSGAGKTTFADLLVGLFPPQSGTIRVGDRPLEHVLAAWRAALSYVSQDPFLFYDTIRRNLDWANPSAGENEMWEALSLCGADSLVRHMENGLDTVVGERGTLVSGGERQRIALARAILRRPRLLVLDEATSAVDAAAERAIVGNILALKPRPTVVMIAHRHESLELCDRVVHLESGAVRDRPAASA